MPPEAWITLVTNVPVLGLAIFGVIHFSRELAGVRRSLDELGGRLIDSLENAIERSDPHISRRSDDENTHDGDTEDLPLLPPPPPKRSKRP